MPLPDQLSPTQRDAHDQLVAALPAGNILELGRSRGGAERRSCRRFTPPRGAHF